MMFKKEMNLSSILSKLRTTSYRISRSHHGCRDASNTANVLTDVSNSLLKNPSKQEAVRNMFNTQLQGKLSKVYVEWRNKQVSKQVSNMVQTAAAEISSLLVPRQSDPLDRRMNVWKMASEVSNVILEDMKKAKDEQNMKTFHLFEEDGKGIDRSGPGAQGDMLRFRREIQQVEENENECRSQEAFESKEMRKNENFWNFYEFQAMERFCMSIKVPMDRWSDFEFEWLRAKSETSKFDKKLERIQQVKKSEYQSSSEADSQTFFHSREEVCHTVSLPKRSDVEISTPKWPDDIHDKVDPQTKPISRKHKSLTEGTGCLREVDNPPPSLAKWMEPLQLGRIDWFALLGGLKQHTSRLYVKVLKFVLGEESFEAKMGDYSMLVEAHLKQNAQGVFKKMKRGITSVTAMLKMYIMAGKPDHVKDALESLRSQGFQLDTKVLNSMITTYVNAGEPKLGESLMREVKSTGVQLTEEMYMALLQSFCQLGDVDGATRIATSMEYSGFLPSLESFTLLIRACGRAGQPHQARKYFDRVTKLGLVPDDRCIASMLVAYERNSFEDDAWEKDLRDDAEEILMFGIHYAPKDDGFTTALDDCFACRILRDKTQQLGRKIEQLLGKIDEKRQPRSQMATRGSMFV